MGEQSPLSLMPLPRSKSQIFTGETWGCEHGGNPGLHAPQPSSLPGEGQCQSRVGLVRCLTWLGCSHRMFSGFRSLWAMPRETEQGVGGGGCL